MKSLVIYCSAVLLFAGCTSTPESGSLKPDFLEKHCGHWIDTAHITDMEETASVTGKSEWEMNFNPSNGTYFATGTVTESPVGRYGYSRTYTPTSPTTAEWTYSDDRSVVSTGTTTQVSNDRCEEVGFDEKGNLSMKTVIIFTPDEVKTTMTYYNDAGAPFLKGTSISVRQ